MIYESDMQTYVILGIVMGIILVLNKRPKITARIGLLMYADICRSLLFFENQSSHCHYNWRSNFYPIPASRQE